MRLLRTGITGFNSSREVAAADLKRAVYAAAQAAGAKVVGVRLADGVAPNFHQIDVEFGSRVLVVLCNRHAPVVGFADRIDGTAIECFTEALSDFASALALRGFVVADAAELNRRPMRDDLKMLSAAEQDLAKYWKPERVGGGTNGASHFDRRIESRQLDAGLCE